MVACSRPGLELGGGPSSGDRTAQVECRSVFHRVARVAPVTRPATPLTIIGESIGEALLFVQALIEHGASQAPRTPIEGLCVSTEEALRHLVGSPPSDVVVIPTNERVRELAVAHSSVLRVVLPATGQPRVMNPLNVSPAEITSVRDFLVGEGVDSGRASQLARSPGGSVSGVLRRPLGSCASFNVVRRSFVPLHSWRGSCRQELAARSCASSAYDPKSWNPRSDRWIMEALAPIEPP